MMIIIIIYIYMILYDHSPFKSFDVWEICDIFMVTKNTFGKKCVVTSCRDVTGMMMLRFGESVPNGPTNYFHSRLLNYTSSVRLLMKHMVRGREFIK